METKYHDAKYQTIMRRILCRMGVHYCATTHVGCCGMAKTTVCLWCGEEVMDLNV